MQVLFYLIISSIFDERHEFCIFIAAPSLSRPFLRRAVGSSRKARAQIDILLFVFDDPRNLRRTDNKWRLYMLRRNAACCRQNVPHCWSENRMKF